MNADDDIDRLLHVYCDGLYAMDPRTTYPFWDYDVTPLYGAQWMERMVDTIDRVGDGPPPCGWTQWFAGPSVPRKELIYSLVDMKVSTMGIQERLAIVQYWMRVLRSWCGDDWLSKGSNRAGSTDDVHAILNAPGWEHGSLGGRAVGRMTVALHALTYGLYSDVFAHQAGETRGPYPLDADTSGRGSCLLVRAWGELSPEDLWPGCAQTGFTRISIAAVYRDCQPAIDIYNHVAWRGIPVDALTKYCVFMDDEPRRVGPSELSAMADDIALLAARQFQRYESLDINCKKRLWVRQRSYQFRRLFAAAGVAWNAPEMEVAVTQAPLRRDAMWNTALDRSDLYGVWKTCLDPRTSLGYDDWAGVFSHAFPGAPGR